MGLLPAGPKESSLPLELQEAIEQRGLVRMEYLDADEKRTERIIEPLRLRKKNGELVLVAHCQLRADQRTFKIERIVQMTRVDEEPTASPPVQVHVQPGLFDEVVNR